MSLLDHDEPNEHRVGPKQSSQARRAAPRLQPVRCHSPRLLRAPPVNPDLRHLLATLGSLGSLTRGLSPSTPVDQEKTSDEYTGGEVSR